MPVDPLLEWRELQDGIQIERSRLDDFTLNPDCPRRRAKVPRETGGLFFVRAELIEIVIASDNFVRCNLLISNVVRGLGGVELDRGGRGKRRQHHGSRAQEPAPVHVYRPGSDIGVTKGHGSFSFGYPIGVYHGLLWYVHRNPEEDAP